MSQQTAAGQLRGDPMRSIVRIVMPFVFCVMPVIAGAQTIPVGPLSQDGPSTPEQLALRVPVTGSLSANATAVVRYRRAGTSSWIQGHPLFRVRPSYSTTPAVGRVVDEFAWPMIDLIPGSTYEVEVTVADGGVSQVLSGTFGTRALPRAAGSTTRTIAAGASSATIQSAINSLSPGDVLELAAGTYNVSGLYIDRSGTEANPIFIRGASRQGTVFSNASGLILQLRNVRDVVVENLTLRGSGVDSGTNASSEGVRGGDPYSDPVRVTVRHVNIEGVDKGIYVYGRASQILVYDNVISGNNRWTSAFLGDNRTWDDDGINLPGYGNAAFNNTISGFGDTFSYAQHVGNDTLTETRSVHYYRNDIRNSIDDAVEVDHAHANITFYDNRIHNASTCSSLDPLYGGPFLYARNVCINPARVNTHKWNATNTGQFFYNNTFVGTVSIGVDADVSAWYQPNNGAQRSYGFRNNLHVYRGRGNTLWLESSGHNPIDWTHNSWFPDRQIQWGGVYSNLAAAQAGLGATTPIFSGSTRRMQNDNITTSNPWTTTVTLGASSLTEATASYTPVLAAGTSPKNSGAIIPNVTDGFAGAAPDRGALIEGRPVPNWGAQSGGSAPTVPPQPPTNLVVQ